MKIGPYTLRNNVIAAPMAGVTDQCFRKLCFRYGAGMVVGEMTSSNPALWQSHKSVMRMSHDDESYPRAVQIAGGDPEIMAQAAKYNADKGAQIIDINMGCPAKKVCKKAAGSALLKDEKLVSNILTAVVEAVDIPVTLKIRTGWDADHKNAPRIAQLAENVGICALAIHGRTRADRYTGEAEYDTIKEIKQLVSIPVIANGDITCAKKAKIVLEYTKADAIMVGRASQGKPWIFREIEHYLRTGEVLPPPDAAEVEMIMLEHLENLYSLYGEYRGTRIARKHVTWYCKERMGSEAFRTHFNTLSSAKGQQLAIRAFFQHQLKDKV